MVSLRRQHVAWSIQQNPTEITVQRIEKKADKGGYLNESSQHGPFKVRIFQSSTNKALQEVSILAGTKHVDVKWGLLADHLANLKAGPSVEDEFDVSSIGRFLVVAVYQQVVQGKVVGLQADLERIT